MLFGPMEMDVTPLQDLFIWLSKNCGEAIDLHSQPFVKAYSGVKLTAVCTGTLANPKHGSKQGIRKVPGAVGPHFEWRKIAENWDYLAALIESLKGKGRSGHQYLSSYPSEDAIVVLSRGEYSDSVLQGC
jgi:hypothetical protein